jgi:hypothetical protein
MRVALNNTLAASKKEPLAELVDRVRQAFLDFTSAEPAIRFTLMDVSSVDRVLKRYPEMERFVTDWPLLGGSLTRVLSNAATGEAADFSVLRTIAAGVPRSYPFKAVVMHFHAPAFGEALRGLPRFGNSLPGVMVTDNRGINGRQRALAAYTVVDVEDGKKLPPLPEPAASVVRACGKVTRTQLVGLLQAIPADNPASVKAVEVIVADYRARMKEIMERARLPHTFPPASEIQDQNPGVLAGPRKPALEAAFRPMGYACRGGSGEFQLTRQTSGNLTVELGLDVGTWSHEVSASFMVRGFTFTASLAIPMSLRDGQYPIGDAAQWQRIVENLAAMVRELDRSFVPEIERVAGPLPTWYQPAS